MAQLTKTRYARALFALAKERDQVDTYYAQAKFFKRVFETEKDFLSVIVHPSIPSAQKAKILTDTFAQKTFDFDGETGEISGDFLGLFQLMLRKNRETAIPDVLESFLDLVREHKGIAVASVTSVAPLSKVQLEKLKGVLSEKLGKELEIETTADESLLTGLRVLVCGKVIDMTGKYELERMKKLLYDATAAV
jgi:F-type H+-transporting ATPase subunit delta